MPKNAKVVINSVNLKYNIRQIKKIIGKRELMAVVKGNAYGHESNIIVDILNKEGITKFCVASIKEAIQIRRSFEDVEILTLETPEDKNIECYRKFNIVPTIYSIEDLEIIIKYNSSIPFEIELDTGIGRTGCSVEEFQTVINYIKDNSLKLKGIYSHLYSNRNIDRSRKQLEKLKKLSKDISVPIHLVNSGGLGLGENFFLDGVRVGQAIYGLIDLKDIGLHLKQVIEIRGKVSKLIKRKKGECIGYNAKHILVRDSKLALINIGYGYGLPKLNKLKGTYENQSVEMIGGMNMLNMCFDVTDCKGIKRGNEIIILNSEGKTNLLNLAKENDILSNVLTCGINYNLFDVEVI